MPLQYAILCHARTGSNYLVNTLSNHPAITAHNELFHESTIYRADAAITDAAIVSKRDAHPVQYLRQVLDASQTDVTGFKHLLFYDSAVTEYIVSQNFHLLLLERENILAQYSSLKIAHQTGQWTRKHGQPPAETPVLQWDEADFEAYRQQYRAAYQRLHHQMQARSAPSMHLTYRNLFTTQQAAQIFEFLGVASDGVAEAHSQDNIQKQNTSHITARFSEPDAVKQYLARVGQPGWAQEHVVSDG